MKNIAKIISIFLTVMLLVGCSENVNENAAENTRDNNTSPSDVGSVTENDSYDDATQDNINISINSDMFTDRDFEVGYDENESILIELNGSSAEASSNSVKIDGSIVTITEDATHIISGTLDDGMIVVNAADTAKLQLVFNGVSVTSSTSAALYIIEADKVFVTLADGSENTLENGGEFEAIDDNNIDGAIFSKQDLTFNGSGSLTISSPADHGIVCKDDLVMTSGTYTVNSASHGIDANDSVRIANAELTIDAGKDGIHTENSDDASLGYFYASSGNITVEAEGDGISAEAYMQLDGGDFTVTAGGGSENGTKSSSDNWGGFMGGRPGGMGGGMGGPGGSFGDTSSSSSDDESSTSMKGLKCTGDINITGGSYDINSADDTLHSNATVTIDGGEFSLASGDDGIHADDTLNINRCNVNILESYEGLEAEHIYVNGGEITLTASDDGINAAGGTDSSGTGGRDGMFGGMGGGMGGPGMSSSSTGSINITGGTLYINASGDGIDANGSLEITGGHTTVVGPTQGDTATLDYDSSASIKGGTFIGTGASGMAQTFSNSEQGVIAVSVGSQSAGNEITISDSDGNIVLSYAPELSYQVLIFSSPDLVSGDSYTISVGNDSGEVKAQ